MKLLKLWKSYKKLSGIKNRTLYCNLSPSIEKCLLPFCILLIFFISSFSGCEEKVPTLPHEKPLTDFRYLKVSWDSITDTTQHIYPKLGSSELLFVGKNDQATAFSLIRFDSLSPILDTLNIENPVLRIQPSIQISPDPASPKEIHLSVSLLKSETASEWSEETSNAKNFYLSDFMLEYLDSTLYDPNDTTQLYLYFELPDTLLSFWRDTSKTNYGLVIQEFETGQQCIQALSSSEVYKQDPLIQYSLENDTVLYEIEATEDISIIHFHNMPQTNGHLRFSDGIASHSFLKFNLPDSILNENLVIGKARLHLSIDTLETENYNKDFYLYLSLIDSSEWGNLDYSPLVEEADAYYTVNPGDSTLIFSISNVVQQITSGYHENLGVVIWSSSSTIDLSVLSVYGSSYSDSLKRPYLEILVMEEK